MGGRVAPAAARHERQGREQGRRRALTARRKSSLACVVPRDAVWLARRARTGHTASVLARYQIVRGKRAPDDPLPVGKRIDTRKHTRHFLRPEADQVHALLEARSASAHARFARAYQALLAARFEQDRAPFDALAKLAAHEDVYLGCSCPSSANPDVQRCHTVLALRFMRKKYPRLDVRFP